MKPQTFGVFAHQQNSKIVCRKSFSDDLRDLPNQEILIISLHTCHRNGM